jgi:hypothetical protein
MLGLPRTLSFCTACGEHTPHEWVEGDGVVAKICINPTPKALNSLSKDAKNGRAGCPRRMSRRSSTAAPASRFGGFRARAVGGGRRVRLGRGAVVVVELDPAIGREQRGVRPCVVVTDPDVIGDQRFLLVWVGAGDRDCGRGTPLAGTLLPESVRPDVAGSELYIGAISRAPRCRISAGTWSTCLKV